MAAFSGNDLSEPLDSLVFYEESDEVFLADDFEELEEDQSRLAEAVCFEVNEILSVLHRIASSPNEIEANIAIKILEKESTETVSSFTQQLNLIIIDCYQAVSKIKNENSKILALEKEFRKQRGEHSEIYRNWEKLVDTVHFSKKDITAVFQHVLQHVWSHSVLRGSDLNNKTLTQQDGQQTHCQKRADQIEKEAIRQHAGWAIKRTRDSIVSGGGPFIIRTSCDNPTAVEVDKDYLLRIISKFGKDERQDSGKFTYVPSESMIDFFLNLHIVCERLLKDESTLASKGRDSVIWTLKELSKNPNIRVQWESVVGKSSGYAKAAHIILLQRVVTFFLKSKQQIVREQLQLKPQKSSQSLRQGLQKGQRATEANITNAAKQALASVADKNTLPELIKNVRQNISDTETVVRQFLMVLKVKGVDVMKKDLQYLTGKELSKILKSLGLPSFSGKSKMKQIDTLLGHLNSVENVNIKHPEQV